MVCRFVVAAFAVFVSLMASGTASAQTSRLVGKIDKVDGDRIVVQPLGGGNASDIELDKNLTVFAVSKGTVAELKQGAFIGVGAMPQPDGSQLAMQITVFAESQRGLGEGFRPWDRAPGSTMTNATIDTTVAAMQGQTLLVKYKGGEQKIIVPPDVVILSYAPGDRAEIKPGTSVVLSAVKRKPDGSLSADRINVGRGDVVLR